MKVIDKIIEFGKDFYTKSIDFLDEKILKELDINTEQLVKLVVITFVTLFVINRIKNYFINKLEKVASQTENTFDDKLLVKLKSIGWLFYSAITVFVVSQFVGITGTLEKIIMVFTIIIVASNLIKLIDLIVPLILISSKKRNSTEEIDLTIKNLLTIALKTATWLITLLLIFSALGQDLGALTAGLGVSGVIIAFALQNVLGDLFSSISIYFDQPFKVGDYVEIGTDSGNIQKIGLKSTRIKTLRGEELTISNSELTSQRIRNFRKLRKRRVDFELGVTYNTPYKTIEKIPEMIKEIIEKVEKVEFSRCHFTDFSDSSLLIKTTYHVKSGDITEHLDIKQQINLEIFKKFEKEKIEFAFPTQTVHLVK